MDRSLQPIAIFSSNHFDGLLRRRVLAAFIDYAIVAGMACFFWFIGIALAIVTFGLLLIPLLLISFPVIDIFYTTYTLGGPAQATLGQRICGISAWDEDGKPPNYMRAFLYIALYYALIVPTSHLLELIVFFNERKRTIPDILSGIVFIRES